MFDPSFPFILLLLLSYPTWVRQLRSVVPMWSLTIMSVSVLSTTDTDLGHTPAMIALEGV